MTTDSRAVLDARTATLHALLAASLTDGVKNDFDAPSERAVLRARDLLDHFARVIEDISPFEVAVAVDGAIEITALLGKLFLTADVSPSGERVEALLDEPASGAVAWASRDAAPHEILREIERAA